uniref:uncharacterized protein LOC132666666 isoform X2 n=1 Tax=Panthera onca TaxID=9690 RepID=UPI0029539B31|nr:uncharacterized protein LOC132666666 isoform X2 [Panthera onca]
MPTSLTSGQNCFPHTCKTLECPSAVGCRMSSLSGDYRSVGTQHAQVISNTHVLLPCPIHGDFSGVRSPDAPRTLRKGKRLTMAVEQRTSRTVGFWIQPYMCTWHQTRLCHGAVCFPHGKWLNQFYFIHRSVWLYHQSQIAQSENKELFDNALEKRVKGWFRTNSRKNDPVPAWRRTHVLNPVGLWDLGRKFFHYWCQPRPGNR